MSNEFGPSLQGISDIVPSATDSSLNRRHFRREGKKQIVKQLEEVCHNPVKQDGGTDVERISEAIPVRHEGRRAKIRARVVTDPIEGATTATLELVQRRRAPGVMFEVTQYPAEVVALNNNQLTASLDYLRLALGAVRLIREGR